MTDKLVFALLLIAATPAFAACDPDRVRAWFVQAQTDERPFLPMVGQLFKTSDELDAELIGRAVTAKGFGTQRMLTVLAAGPYHDCPKGPCEIYVSPIEGPGALPRGRRLFSFAQAIDGSPSILRGMTCLGPSPDALAVVRECFRQGCS